jgi:predicted NBD/HSP70 family sugar kinase
MTVTRYSMKAKLAIGKGGFRANSASAKLRRRAARGIPVKWSRMCAILSVPVVGLAADGFGVGGGIILDGHPFWGFRGLSGELGHIVVDRGSGAKRCGCGKVGCLETRTSMRSLYQHLSDRLACKCELPQLADLFRSRDEALMEWLETGIGYLSVTLPNLQLLFDPEAFVIGGHLPRSLLGFICKRCAKIVASERQPQGTNIPKILRGSLGDEAAAIGAATLPTHNLIAPNYQSIANEAHSNLLTLVER